MSIRVRVVNKDSILVEGVSIDPLYLSLEQAKELFTGLAGIRDAWTVKGRPTIEVDEVAIYRMHVVDGKSVRCIAKEVGVSKATVWRVLRRCKEKG